VLVLNLVMVYVLLTYSRLGLSDFLRGKLVERLREEEKKELR
jgi:hypothetical protein